MEKFIEIRCQYCGRIIGTEQEGPAMLRECICDDCVNDICDIMQLEYGLREEDKNYEQDYLSYM